MSAVNAEIQSLLDDVESRQGVEILYACESGSRAWGFHSPDSDYDIRFLYRRPIEDCYLVESGADTIELPIEGDLDPGGWELRKALGLLTKSNGALIEWLHSPIVYRANPTFHDEIKSLACQFLSRKGLANHYRGMAHKVIESLKQSTAPSGKSYLYALRALLSMKHVLETGTPPPVEFSGLLYLLSDQDRTAVDNLLEWKKTAREKDSPGRIHRLDGFLHEGLGTLGMMCDRLPGDLPDREPFNDFLHRWTCWSQKVRKPMMVRADFTLARVRESDLCLFEAVSGSRSFGTHHAKSDTDLRGVFVAPDSFLTGLETIDQVSDEKSDEVSYEVERFVSLLVANNPNIVELLFTPESCIRRQHPAFELIRPEDFLSKLCRQTFGNYALGQIRKARGLNKKIVNPEPEERRHLREFCHVLDGQGSVALSDWLASNGLEEAECALTAVNHAPGTYAIYRGVSTARGLFARQDNSGVICSSVPKEAVPLGWMHCNYDAFKAHCRSHREYWKWVGERNEERFKTNSSHGRGYDSKNLMHTLRLLEQAIEIAREGRIILPRPNSDWLKEVKSGAFEYEDLLQIAEEKSQEMEAAFDASMLQEKPSREKANEVLLEVRSQF